MTKHVIRSAALTARAARAFTRRTLLKQAAAAGAVTIATPYIAGPSFGQSSGELNVFSWSDYIYPEMIESFEAETGIKLVLSTYGSNDEVLNRLRASAGEGFDIVMPSITYVPVWLEQELLQPIDESRVNVAGVIPSMWDSSATLGGVRNGERFACPFNWGTEGLCIDTSAIDAVYGVLGYGDIWAEKDRATVRAHSSLLGIGLYLDSIGEIDSDNMRATYTNEAQMREIYETLLAYAVEHKDAIVQFWSNAQETEAAFLVNGATIGLTWDGPAMRMRTETGGKITYLAPKEGALTWMDSIAIPKGARNVDQAYAFLDWYYKPDHGALFVRLSGYSTCAANAAPLAGEEYAANFAAAYPGSAIEDLWWYPPEPAWFVAARNEFRDRLLSA